jgi:hypothetical protein
VRLDNNIIGKAGGLMVVCLYNIGFIDLQSKDAVADREVRVRATPVTPLGNSYIPELQRWLDGLTMPFYPVSELDCFLVAD